MKKCMVALLVSTILLSSCGGTEIDNKGDKDKINNTSKVEAKEEIDDKGKEEGVEKKEFSKEGNPIEADRKIEQKMLNENYSMSYDIEIREKYYKVWDDELNNVYNKLLESLDEDRKSQLIESQQGWLEYYIKDTRFAYKTFRERKSGSILGTLMKIQQYYADLGKLRDRTIELIDYYNSVQYHGEYGYEYKYKRELQDKDKEYGVKNEENNDDKEFEIWFRYDTGGEYSNIINTDKMIKDYEKKMNEAYQNSDYYKSVWSVINEYTELWDDELNYIYNKLVKNLKPEEKEVLLEAQLGWIEFNDTESKVFISMHRDIASTNDKIDYGVRKIERIRQRTLELMEYNYLLDDDYDLQFKNK